MAFGGGYTLALSIYRMQVTKWSIGARRPRLCVLRFRILGGSHFVVYVTSNERVVHHERDRRSVGQRAYDRF